MTETNGMPNTIEHQELESAIVRQVLHDTKHKIKIVETLTIENQAKIIDADAESALRQMITHRRKEDTKSADALSKLITQLWDEWKK